MFFLLQMSRWGILSPALLSSYPASVSISHRAASTGSWARITQEVRTNERVWSIFSYLPRWTCRSPASPNLSYSVVVSSFKRGFLLSLLSLKLRPKHQTLNNINNNITQNFMCKLRGIQESWIEPWPFNNRSNRSNCHNKVRGLERTAAWS